MVNEINDADREDIVSQFSKAVEGGATQAALDAARNALRAKYCPHKYTAPQVDGVCSQVIIQRNRLLRLTRDAGQTPETSATASPVDSGVVKSTKKTAIATPKRKDPEDEDYDNELKREWRKKWFAYVENQTTSEQRKNMKVLCLPGKYCLEIPHYLELGFTPSNIVGAIKTDNADSEDVFMANATKYGFRPLIGDLVGHAPNFMEPFDVVSLDFRSCLSPDIFDIIKYIPIAQRAVLMMNILGKREGVNEVKNDLRNHYKSVLQSRDFYEGKMPYTNPFSMDTDEPPELIDARSNTPLIAILIGSERKDRWCDQKKLEELAAYVRRDPQFIKRIQKAPEHFQEKMRNETLFVFDHLQRVFLLFSHSLAELLGQVKLPMDFPHRGILEFMESFKLMNALGTRGLSFLADLKKYKYINDKGSPFYTDMAVVEIPTEEYRNIRYVLEFTLLCQMAMAKYDSSSEYVVDHETQHHFCRFITKSRMPVFPGAVLARSNLLEVQVNGQHAAEISAGRLLDAIQSFSKIENRYPLNTRYKTLEIPREDIKVG